MTAASNPTETLYREALKYIPGGTSRLHYHYAPYPIYARSAGGCRLIDVEGVERIDFLNNMTALIHGHAHPRVIGAIAGQLGRGTVWSEPGEAEVELIHQRRHYSITAVPFPGAEGTPHADTRQAFRQGIIVNALNPKTALFFLSIFPRSRSVRG